jgi:hypothetical protein
LCAVFKLGFNNGSYILGNWAFLRIPNETQKVKKTSAKEKIKACLKISTSDNNWTQ